MKITYFFPVFECDDAKNFFEFFFASKFYNEHLPSTIFACVKKDDKKNVKYLSNIAKKNENFQLFLCEGDFEFNDAFAFCLNKFDCDILLLGDCKIKKIENVFAKCIEKHQKGASVVHVCKRRGKFKTFFVEAKNKIYKLNL